MIDSGLFLILVGALLPIAQAVVDTIRG